MLRLILVSIFLFYISSKYTGPPIFHAAQVVVNDTIYLFQGSRIDSESGKRIVLDKLLTLDTYKDFKISDSPWEESDIDGSIPGLDSTSCSLFKPNFNSFLCIGGKYQDSSLQLKDGSPIIYDVINHNWLQAAFSTNDQPSSRFGHTMAPLPDGSGIVLLGGADPSSSVPFNDFWHLSSLRKWEQLKTNGIPPCYYHTMSIVNSEDSYKIVVIGGKRSENSLVPTDSVLVYEHETETWKTQEVRFPIIPRHSHSAVVNGKSIIVFGGTNADSSVFYSDIVSLNTETWEWSTLFSSNGIAGRYGHSSALLGNLMLIFFGLSRSLGSQTYIFNIATKSFVSQFRREDAFPKSPTVNNTGSIIGGVIGGIIFLIFSFFLIRYCLRRNINIKSNKVIAAQPPVLQNQVNKPESFFELPIESGLEEFSSQEWPVTPENQLNSQLNFYTVSERVSERISRSQDNNNQNILANL